MATIGWVVWLGVHSDAVKTFDKTKWTAISKKFTVRSAADGFMELAAKQHPGAKLEVRSVERDDGIRSNI